MNSFKPFSVLKIGLRVFQLHHPTASKQNMMWLIIIYWAVYMYVGNTEEISYEFPSGFCPSSNALRITSAVYFSGTPARRNCSSFLSLTSRSLFL